MNGVELTMVYQVFFPNASLFKEVHAIHFITAVTNNWTPSIPVVNDSVTISGNLTNYMTL